MTIYVAVIYPSNDLSTTTFIHAPSILFGLLSIIPSHFLFYYLLQLINIHTAYLIHALCIMILIVAHLTLLSILIEYAYHVLIISLTDAATAHMIFPFRYLLIRFALYNEKSCIFEAFYYK